MKRVPSRTGLPAARLMRKQRVRLRSAAAAGLLSGLWLGARLRSSLAERALPPVGGLVRANGVQLHYVTRGRGQPVVMLHGAWVLMQDFLSSSVFEHVAARYQAIAFDRPGYGYSSRPGRPISPWEQARLLRAGLHTLGIERPVLVGHSHAGAVVLAYAAQFPEEIAGVVFINGLAYPMPRVDLVPYMLPAIPVAGTVLRHTVLQPIYRVSLPAVFKASFWPQKVPPAFCRSVPLDMVLRPRQLRATAEDLAALVPSLRQLRVQYARIAVPVAIVAGDADRVAPPENHAIPLSKELPRATLILLPGVGHMAHHFRQDAVMSAIAQVLDEPAAQVTAGI